MMKPPILALAVAAVLLPAATAQISLSPITTVDLNPTANPMNAEYIGTNPASIAWDGTTLFVAGFNNGGSTDNVAIVPVTTPLGTPAFGTTFGVLAAPSLRGYSGIAVDGGSIAAAYDSGATDANGLVVYDMTGTPQWSKSIRGGSSTAFDPGFPGGMPAMGQGVAWTQFGSGRRALQDAATGADIWTTANGMIITTGGGTFWRDMDFDPATGDMWLRESNRVVRAARTGDNACTAGALDLTPAGGLGAFVNQQNIAFVDAPTGSFVIYNDRATAGTGQAFGTVVQAILPDGTPATLDFGGFTAPTGGGNYDFAYDSGSNTLAILDGANRKVYFFGLASAPPKLQISLGIRETGSAAAIGADGGTAGSIEWIDLDGQELTLDGTWQQFSFHLDPTDPMASPVSGFTGDGMVTGTAGTIEHIRIKNFAGITDEITLSIDDVTDTVNGVPTDFGTFEGYADDTEAMFQEPSFSGSTSSNLAAAPAPNSSGVDNYTASRMAPGSDQVRFQFVDNSPTRWVRLTTFAASNQANPTIAFDQGSVVSFWMRGTTKLQPNLGSQGPGTAIAELVGTGLDALESCTYYVAGAPSNGAGVLALSGRRRHGRARLRWQPRVVLELPHRPRAPRGRERQRVVRDPRHRVAGRRRAAERLLGPERRRPAAAGVHQRGRRAGRPVTKRVAARGRDDQRAASPVGLAARSRTGRRSDGCRRRDRIADNPGPAAAAGDQRCTRALRTHGACALEPRQGVAR